VPNLDHDGDPGAAGERIVAFARPGKPPEIRFVGRSDLLGTPTRIRQFLTKPQRFLKPTGVALCL
jgi:hypothetical protein